MKRLVAVILMFCLCLPALAAAKSEDDLLAETVALSREIKEFGRSIGIEPTGALTKSLKEKTPVSVIILYFQKKGSVEFSFFERAVLSFNMDAFQMPIAGYWLWNKQFSVFVRQLSEFSGDEAVITPAFAKESLTRKAEVILHEDLHGAVSQDSDAGLAETQEILVTPLGSLAALKYFESKNDAQNITAMKRMIDYFKKISLELNALEKDIAALSKEFLPALVCPAIYEKKILNNYPALKARLLNMTKPFSMCAAEEAVITHELRYWKYFARVVDLYEKSGDIRLLIEDMKKAPGKLNDLNLYLDDLNKKYSNPAVE